MLVLLVLFAVQLSASSGAVVFSLNGDDWTLSGSNITVSARVPGGIYTDLMRSKEIDDPYYRMNDVSLRWVAMANWTYTKTFNLEGDYLNYKANDLVVGGLDTVARIFLNDVCVLETNNMFRRYVKEVTKFLKLGDNVIRVEFQSPVTYALDQAKRYPYMVPPGCPPAVQHGECHFNFIRKEAASFSWDWGPSFPSMGIWRNITFEAYQASVMRYVTTETEFIDNFWILHMTFFFDLESSRSSIQGFLYIDISELGLSYSKQLTLSPGDTRQEVSLPLSSAVEEWWPNGLGGQKLYEVLVQFRNVFGDVDRRVIHVGFRTVELVEEVVGGEEPGYSFYFKINGIPVFAKGSNWIPADSFQERINASYLEKLLGSAAEANMNMLRVWGGGVYESEEFYEIADRLGIMIWQDFMYACALYPVNDDFLLNVEQEVIHQVRRLKRHPSIVIWSGNNENEGALAGNWYNVSSEQFNQFSADYKKLYIQTIRQIVLVEDRSRPFVPSSPSNGLDTAEEGWIAKNPQSTRYGDIHYYTYDGDTWNWRTFPMPRFASEFGIQSWCSLETLLPVSLPVDRNIYSDFVWHRQHHDEGNEQIRDEIAMHMPLPASLNLTQRFIDFIYLSQINQAVGIKTEVEFYRRSQSILSDGHGLTMGALYWQLNDIWQGPTWASIEYGGKWKMLHYYAKRFFSRSLISPFEEDGLLKVYYVDDGVWSSTSDALLKHHTSDLGGKPSRGMEGLEGRQQDVVHMMEKEYVEKSDAEIELRIDCYHWSSLEEKKSWKIVVKKPSLPAQCIHMSRLSDLMQECRCTEPSRCFFYFTAFGVATPIPDNYLFLTNLSAIVGLERAHVKISELYPFNSTFAKIVLLTDRISPFTWLEAPGYSGRFSDNGFLMVNSELLVTYSAWEPVDDWQKFRESLAVRTFLDVYED